MSPLKLSDQNTKFSINSICIAVSLRADFCKLSFLIVFWAVSSRPVITMFMSIFYYVSLRVVKNKLFSKDFCSPSIAFSKLSLEVISSKLGYLGGFSELCFS